MMDVLFVQELGLKGRINCWGIKTVILVMLNLKNAKKIVERSWERSEADKIRGDIGLNRSTYIVFAKDRLILHGKQP